MKTAGLNIIIIVIAGTFFLFADSWAQDVHFTQVQATPLLLNPANTGTSGCALRLINNFRSQWNEIAESYKTYSIAVDKSLVLWRQPVGVGAILIHDLSSGNHLIADKFFFSLSLSRFFRNHQISLGIQPGIVLRYFDQQNLSFDSQFDNDAGIFDRSLPSRENLLADRLSYIDGNAGLLWRSQIKKYQVTAGFAVSHLTRPVESFMKNADDGHLPLKYNLNASIIIPLTDQVDLIPMGLYSGTSGAREFIGGGLVGYAFTRTTIPVRSIYTLILLRINPFRNMDALMVGGGLRILGFDICLSYDINISALHKASNYYGAFEISLIYRNCRIRSKETAEPCYML
ncbi:MAG: PorP/SprF family type IX secretion system membrane protein [Bacteroidales bacterium]|nr:PorP/SprF family type IX secretion system membrane protein [Bacteroidales bacterium]